MKTLKLYIAIAAVGIFTMASCNKEETKDYTETFKYDVTHGSTDGQARVKGNVTYLNASTGVAEIAPWAVIKIADDTTSKVFTQYWMADSLGYYNVKGLGVGSYYITAQYTDQFTGAKFTSPGAVVIVNNSVDDILLNLQTK